MASLSSTRGSSDNKFVAEHSEDFSKQTFADPRAGVHGDRALALVVSQRVQLTEEDVWIGLLFGLTAV